MRWRLVRHQLGSTEDETKLLIGMYAYGVIQGMRPYPVLPKESPTVLYLDRGLGDYKIEVIRHQVDKQPTTYDVAVYVRKLVWDDDMVGYDQLTLQP